MPACVYNTSPSWIGVLRSRGVRDNVNFWRKDRRTLHLSEGSAFYFKVLGASQVVGRGFFRESVTLTPAEAWQRFGIGNGYGTDAEFRAGLTDMLGVNELPTDATVNCLVLDGLEWLDRPLPLRAGFFPQGVLGAKFYEDAEIASIAAHFSQESVPGAVLPPLVLVQADATAGGAFDHWDDQTGERYHFPNQYRNRIVSGRRFIYYRGVRRRDGGRGPAEYFGTGRIGDVWLDPATANAERKTDRAWFCSIEDFQPFNRNVPAVVNGSYYEALTHARAWQTGVRVLTEDGYDAILTAAGLSPSTISSPEPNALVALRETTGLLRPRVRVMRSADGVTRARDFRRSRRANAIGRRAEALVRDLLQQRFANVRWLSVEGDLPGYDLAYEHEGYQHAVEVKGTTGRYFPAIELTVNEWRAAESLGDRFWLYLVTQCESSEPCVQVIRNPAAILAEGLATLQPLLLRFELHNAKE